MYNVGIIIDQITRHLRSLRNRAEYNAPILCIFANTISLSVSIHLGLGNEESASRQATLLPSLRVNSAGDGTFSCM